MSGEADAPSAGFARFLGFPGQVQQLADLVDDPQVKTSTLLKAFATLIELWQHVQEPELVARGTGLNMARLIATYASTVVLDRTGLVCGR